MMTTRSRAMADQIQLQQLPPLLPNRNRDVKFSAAHLHFAEHCLNDLPSIVIQGESMCLTYYLHHQHSKWAHPCNLWKQQYHRNNHLESQHLHALLLQQFFWRRGMYTHDSCPTSVDFITLAGQCFNHGTLAHMQDRRDGRYSNGVCFAAAQVEQHLVIHFLTLYVYSENAVKDSSGGAKKLHILALSHHKLGWLQMKAKFGEYDHIPFLVPGVKTFSETTQNCQDNSFYGAKSCSVSY